MAATQAIDAIGANVSIKAAMPLSTRCLLTYSR
jgi:hypothetical protein